MIGVVVMAYGTPSGPEDVERYYTHVRGGRPPSAELLEELRERYALLPGGSPLLQITNAQAAGLADALGATFRVAVGMKHAEPWLEDAVADLRTQGVDRLAGIVLAPHYAAASIGSYERRLRDAAGDLDVVMVQSWHLDPSYLGFLADEVRAAVAKLDGDPDGVEVVFTAHSLPLRALGDGDPYPEQLRQTAEAVAALAGVPRWRVAWQSAGRTPDPWLGPDLLTVMRERAAVGVRGIVVCSAGFVSDHLEVLYDLDVEAAGVAAELGVAFARTRSPNDDPRLTRALVHALTSALDAAGREVVA